MHACRRPVGGSPSPSNRLEGLKPPKCVSKEPELCEPARSLLQAGSVKRPVWLFSLDTEQFSAVPMTTGRLKAYFQRFGRTPEGTDVELVHFSMSHEIDVFLRE